MCISRRASKRNSLIIRQEGSYLEVTAKKLFSFGDFFLLGYCVYKSKYVYLRMLLKVGTRETPTEAITF